MKILIIGSGGREHTIAWKLNQSPVVENIFVAPGNGGTDGFCINVNIRPDDINTLKNFALDKKIDYTIVGPEVPLVLGIVDAFQEVGLKIIGPNKEASQLEGSKAFTKSFLQRHGINTSPFVVVNSYDEAINNLGIYGYPMVIKADGLAGGKGVVIAQNEQEARLTFEDMLIHQTMGEAGSKVVIEAFVPGIEASLLCFVDGKTILPMAPAQDYKKIGEGGKGLNTGGMGSFSPSQVMTDVIQKQVKREILEPFIKGCHKEGITFKGILFVGLMINDEGISVIELNVRFGDPETQVILPRMKNDLMVVFDALYHQTLDQVELSWKEEAALCVVMASGGYPVAYEKGHKILGLEAIHKSVKDGSLEKKVVFHSGTKKEGYFTLTNGGRVLNAVAMGKNLEEAKKGAYEIAESIRFENCYYRKDIGDIIRR